MWKSNVCILALNAWIVTGAAFGADKAQEGHATRRTFCNPLNLDYGWAKPDHRHAADPVIVPFKDRYYLFTTWDGSGFRVSDNLIDWRYVPFPEETLPWVTSEQGGYCAPAAAAHDGWLYFINMKPRKGKETCTIVRTQDPLSGRWEKCSEIRRVRDPDLFFDDDGRVYLYYGLGGPTFGFELDPETMTEIPGTHVELRPRIESLDAFYGGYERGKRDVFAEIDTGPFLDKFTNLPCPEAAWMTKRNGRYYLQYATPGTVSHWYCDTVMEGDSPTGPFHHVDYAPVSMKVGGFIGSAGHSCVFQDKHDNWWRVTTMWIGVYHLFERRIGLFPVRFDDEGRMHTITALRDYPQVMPNGPHDPNESLFAGWWVLSFGQSCMASSSLADHPPSAASDENVRTWWSAESGEPGEWFQMDLGRPRDIRAIQVNFAEQDCHADSLRISNDYHRYKLLASTDGQTWRTVADKSDNETAVPHDYLALPEATTVRYLRVENVSMPAGGKFAIRDLRVFGPGDGQLPARPEGLVVNRHADDDRNVSLKWSPAAGADGYLIRYGIAADKLWQCIQLQDRSKCSLSLHTLNRGVDYVFRVDAFNDSGLTVGQPVPSKK